MLHLPLLLPLALFVRVSAFAPPLPFSSGHYASSSSLKASKPSHDDDLRVVNLQRKGSSLVAAAWIAGNAAFGVLSSPSIVMAEDLFAETIETSVSMVDAPLSSEQNNIETTEETLVNQEVTENTELSGIEEVQESEVSVVSKDPEVVEVAMAQVDDMATAPEETLVASSSESEDVVNTEQSTIVDAPPSDATEPSLGIAAAATTEPEATMVAATEESILPEEEPSAVVAAEEFVGVTSSTESTPTESSLEPQVLLSALPEDGASSSEDVEASQVVSE